MISNRHVRNDWQRWLDGGGGKRVKTMCNRYSAPRLCGVPGVTEQLMFVPVGKSIVDGWCSVCCYRTYHCLLDMGTDINTSELVRKQYSICYHIVKRQAEAISRARGEQFIPLVYRRIKSGQHADLKNNLPGRNKCYLCQLPDPDSIDYIWPRSLGGQDEPYNLGWTHKLCNMKKGGKTLNEAKVIFPNMILPEWFRL